MAFASLEYETFSHIIEFLVPDNQFSLLNFTALPFYFFI